VQIKERVELGLRSEIVADKNGWWLRFVLPGPDLRYNSDIIEIYRNQIADFRDEIIEGHRFYLAAKPSVTAKAEVEKKFGSITVRVGGYHDGLCIGHYRCLLRPGNGLDRFLAELDRIPGRGEELVAGIRRASGLQTATPSAATPNAEAAFQSRPAPQPSTGKSVAVRAGRDPAGATPGQARERLAVSSRPGSFLGRLFGRNN
jgi:hypothetical protein